ncbi:MAG: DUF5690 family protein [Myxococcales bacterium]|nr:DUF5690 family protein [Myxococcales bacterium]
MPPSSPITRWLERRGDAAIVLYGSVAAFGAYFCMYAFRKPFAAGSYEGLEAFGLDLKTALVVAQVLGYALSKFASIKLLSELPSARRLALLLSLIAVAELGLLGLVVLPPELKVVALFVNGLPLGAVWGLVFSFLEGRRTSEILGATLSMSYIVASGAVKSVGRALMEAGVPELAMPAVTGALFLPAFATLCWLLSRLPAPDAGDHRARSPRSPMQRQQRLEFLRRHALGLFCLTALYVALTAFRDFRDNYAIELWSALGRGAEPAILTTAELPVAASVMLALALIFLVRDNRRALLTTHAIMLAGSLLILGSTLLFTESFIEGSTWMVLVGSGLYLGYVPFGCVLFDRLMALTRSPGTAVFMIYVTDAAGYAGSVCLLLFKRFASPDLPWLSFFTSLSLLTGAACALGVLASALYFGRESLVPQSDP